MLACASTHVGLKAPLVSGPLSATGDIAASSNVRLIPTAGVPVPPASASRTNFLPVGPTSRISKSSGRSWLMLLSVTVTLVIVPLRFEATIEDGYGEPGDVPLGPVGKLMLAVLVKLAALASAPPLANATSNAIIRKKHFIGMETNILSGCGSQARYSQRLAENLLLRSTEIRHHETAAR